jgi:hypothetical protein
MLKAEIREQTRAMEVAQGLERDNALEQLATLRRELLVVVESASNSETSPRSGLALARALLPEPIYSVAPRT